MTGSIIAGIAIILILEIQSPGHARRLRFDVAIGDSTPAPGRGAANKPSELEVDEWPRVDRREEEQPDEPDSENESADETGTRKKHVEPCGSMRPQRNSAPRLVVHTGGEGGRRHP